MTGGAAYPAVLIVAALTAGAALAEGGVVVPVPSGQHVELHEVLLDESPGETWARFRFLAPQIARETGSIGIDAALEDIDSLCAAYAAPAVADMRPAPRQIVISLMDRIVEFGATNPDATQFFEAYRVENGTCIWEGL